MDAGRANKEAEILRKQCKALCQELKEALQEADVAKCRRDWAFQERDKIVAERDSIRYGAPGLAWDQVSHGTLGLWAGPELFALCPHKVGVTSAVNLLTLQCLHLTLEHQNSACHFTLPEVSEPALFSDPSAVTKDQPFFLGAFFLVFMGCLLCARFLGLSKETLGDTQPLRLLGECAACEGPALWGLRTAASDRAAEECV